MIAPMIRAAIFMVVSFSVREQVFEDLVGEIWIKRSENLFDSFCGFNEEEDGPANKGAGQNYKYGNDGIHRRLLS